MEEKNENKVLRVSDCHHAGYRTIDVKKKDGSYKKAEIHVCDLCSRECKVVEMIVEDYS